MPSILLVRHAQASYGATDYDVLSALAAGQTRALREHLPARVLDGGPTVVVSGPRRRHLETADQVFPDVAVEVEDGWDEYSADEVLACYGGALADKASLDGDTALTSRDFQDVLDPALRRWIEDPCGSWPAFSKRTRDALASLANAVPSGGLGVVFTSAGAIASVAAATLAADSTFVPLNRVQVNTGVTKLVVGRAGTSLVSFNDHTHLELVDPALVTYR
jgi:broad specificity phosphatase PhoE